MRINMIIKWVVNTSIFSNSIHEDHLSGGGIETYVSIDMLGVAIYLFDLAYVFDLMRML